MKKTKLIGILMFLLSSCNSESEKTLNHDTVKTYNQSLVPLAVLKEKIYFDGDVESYQELSTHYLDYPEGDFLFWALIMANKHNYANAYLDVYYALKGGMSYIEGEGTFSIDERTDKMLREYLKLAVDYGADNAIRIQDEYFQEYGSDSTHVIVP